MNNYKQLQTQAGESAGFLKTKSGMIFSAVSIIFLIIGIIHASSLLFVNDDAFLSFRYAKNFVKGLGLVFNAGERVEGYTNFLWVMIIAAGMKIGIDPVILSTTLGIIFYSCTLLTFIFLSWRFRSENFKYFFLPLTSIVLSVHRDFNAYATSGLETSMFTFFVSAAFASLLFARSFKSFIITGIFILLVMLTRPDGVIFLIGSLIIVIIKRESFKNIFGLLIPIILIFVPYWIWRYNYYGYPFPNTYYAKSINMPYYSQGIEYAYLYLKTYYGITILLVLIGVAIWKYTNEKKKDGKNIFQRILSNEQSPILAASLFVILYGHFVIRIGGDFMHARFLVPITPLIYFIIEQSIYKLTQKYFAIALASILILSTIFRYDLFKKELNVGYIVDEVRFYPFEKFKQVKTSGETLKKYFSGVSVRAAFWGAQMRMIYYADPQYAIEANAGLTDTALSHQPLKQRGRPGHEKTASIEFLQKKKVNFLFGLSNPHKKDQLTINTILFDSIPAYIVTYNNRLMELFANNPEIKFVRMPKFLDSYLSEIDNYPEEQIRFDYTFLKDFYFFNNDDSTREKAFLTSLRKTRLLK